MLRKCIQRNTLGTAGFITRIGKDSLAKLAPKRYFLISSVDSGSDGSDRVWGRVGRPPRRSRLLHGGAPWPEASSSSELLGFVFPRTWATPRPSGDRGRHREFTHRRLYSGCELAGWWDHARWRKISRRDPKARGLGRLGLGFAAETESNTRGHYKGLYRAQRCAFWQGIPRNRVRLAHGHVRLAHDERKERVLSGGASATVR